MMVLKIKPENQVVSLSVFIVPQQFMGYLTETVIHTATKIKLQYTLCPDAYPQRLFAV
jgi:hypothetical protein